MVFSEEEMKLQKTPYEISFVDEESGKTTKVKKVVVELIGGRKQNKSKEYEYEVKYAGSTSDSGDYLPAKTLKKMGWERPSRLLISRSPSVLDFTSVLFPRRTLRSISRIVVLPPSSELTTVCLLFLEDRRLRLYLP